MGKASIKENKKIYQLIREELNMTREAASEIIDGMEPYRLNKIENEATPTPDEVYNMSKAYKRPDLCSYYCANECRIGKETDVKEIRIKDLSNIVLGMLNKLHTMDAKKEKLISISADGEVDDEELEDFYNIQVELNQMAELIDTLKIWTNKMIYEGKIDERRYKDIQSKKSNLQKK